MKVKNVILFKFKKYIRDYSFKNFLIFLSILCYDRSYGDILANESLFSEILDKADFCVYGEIVSTSSSKDNFEMLFTVEEILLNSISEKQIKILSKVSNGFSLPEEPYLNRGEKIILF